jgi:hypothetical protein
MGSELLLMVGMTRGQRRRGDRGGQQRREGMKRDGMHEEQGGGRSKRERNSPGGWRDR